MIRFPTKRSFFTILHKNLTKEYPSSQLASITCLSPFSSTSNFSTSSTILSNKIQNNVQASFLSSLKSNFLSSLDSQNSKALGFSPIARFCSTIKPSLQGRYYVQLKNMNYSQKTAEIYKLLTDLGVQISSQDIILRNRFDGKYSGDAFVLCHSQEDLKKILALDNTKIASRYIKALPATEDEFDKARIANKPLSQEVISQESNPNQHNRWSHLLEDHLGVIKLKHVPFDCQKEDIRAFFEGFKIVEDGIQRRKEGTTCFVIFESRSEAHQAKATAEAKEVLKHITFKESNIPILEHFLREIDVENKKGQRKRKKRVPEEKKVRVLMMRNVPATVTKEDILKFFEGFELEEKDVRLMMNRAGVLTGRVQIMLKSQEDVHKAFIEKNLSRLGGEYIELSDYWG